MPLTVNISHSNAFLFVVPQSVYLANVARDLMHCSRFLRNTLLLPPFQNNGACAKNNNQIQRSHHLAKPKKTLKVSIPLDQLKSWDHVVFASSVAEIHSSFPLALIMFSARCHRTQPSSLVLTLPPHPICHSCHGCPTTPL